VETLVCQADDPRRRLKPRFPRFCKNRSDPYEQHMSGRTNLAETNHVAPLISVVLPLFNERAVLRQLYHDVARSLHDYKHRIEVIFVNDGSSDGSAVILDELAERDPRVRVLHLSRNFGHQAAVQAGLAHARGDAVIVMDSDLQDDPQCLPEFIRQWQAGHDVVYAVRTKRKEGLAKRMLFFTFYRLLNAISNTPIPNDAGNFGLISRPVVDQLVQLGEYDRFYPGLRQWVGFKQVGVAVERNARHDGTPRVTMFGLFRLAKTAIFSFSSAPLALFYGIAAFSFFLFALVGVFAVFRWRIAEPVPSWTTMVMMSSAFGALNALGIAVLGEYVARIYDQVRGRPSFIVASQRNGAERKTQTDATDDTASHDLHCHEAPVADALSLQADALSLQADVSDAVTMVALSTESR